MAIVRILKDYKQLLESHYYLQNTPILLVSHAKYLGVVIDRN